MKSQKTISHSSERLFPGVRKRKSGKFCAEIKHPFNKKRIWLGTFITAEEASKVYESKKLEFDDKVKAKNLNKSKNIKSEKSEDESGSSNTSLKVDADISDSSNGVEEKSNSSIKEQESEDIWMGMGQWVQISEDKEVIYSTKLGVPIVDNYGFLLGEFSKLDDLRLSVCDIIQVES